jgi:trigger factor
VTLDAQAVDKGFNAVYRELAGSMKIPGFRQGKIPPNIIRQRVGIEALQQEVGQNLREKAIDEGLKELNLSPRRGDTIWHDEGSASAGQDFVVEISQPVLPEVTLPDLVDASIEVVRPPVSREMLDRFQNRLIERFSKVQDIEGKAGAGDSLIIGVHSRFADSDEEAPFGGHDILFSIGKEGNLPGWDEQLSGLGAGDEKDFEYEMPSDYSDPLVAGKKLKMHVHIDRAARVERPEFDEAFVTGRLGLESLAQYEDYRRAVLEREVDVQLADEIANRCGKLLAEGVSAELSPDMLAQEIDSMVTEADQMLRQQGLSLDAYLQNKGQTIQEYRGGLTDAATSKLKFHLGIVEYAKVNEMSVGYDEISRYAQALMERENISPDEMRQYLRNRAFVNEISYNLIRDKVLGALAGVIKVTVKDEGAEASTEQQ